MIQYCQESEGEKEFVTTGCGCCSSNLYLPQDREEIIKELKFNVVALKESCALLGIDVNEFIK